PGGLHARQVEDGVDGLLLGGLDEAARVHHQHVGRLGVQDELVPAAGEHAEHHLAVDPVLGTAEGEEVDAAGLSHGSSRTAWRYRGRARGGASRSPAARPSSCPYTGASASRRQPGAGDTRPFTITTYRTEI